MPNQSFEEKLEERMEEIDNFLGSPLKILEEYRDKTCFVCGQPFNKSPQVDKLKQLFRTAITTQREETIKECIEALPPKESEYWGEKESLVRGKAIGFNNCRHEAKQSLLNLIKP